MMVDLPICRKSAHQQPLVHTGSTGVLWSNTVDLTLNVIDVGLPICLQDLYSVKSCIP